MSFTWQSIIKVGSKLFDIADVDVYGLAQAGFYPKIKADGSGVEWVELVIPEPEPPPVEVPPGMIIFRAGNVVPTGYIKANGTPVSRTDYADLWTYAQASGCLVTEAAWTGGDYGKFSQGDGSTTFRVPDLRGEFIRVWDDGRGVDSGRAINSMQSHQIQDHGHSASTSLFFTLSSGAGSYQLPQIIGNDNSGMTVTVGNPNSGNHGTETRGRSVALLGLIKY